MADTMKVSFLYGDIDQLPGTLTPGAVYFVTGESAIYADLSADTRIRIGNFVEVADMAALEQISHPSTNTLYFIRTGNILLQYNGTTKEYEQINPDTGAATFTVVGDGNAITNVSYNAVTRTLTLTKGETFATKQQLDDLANDVGGNVSEQIEEEANARKTADTAINAAFAAADSDLANDISDEANARKAGDDAINAAYKAADAALANDIVNEANARGEAINGVKDLINGVSEDLEDEANARKATDTAINAAYTAADEVIANAASEALNTAKSALANDISNEANTRAQADSDEANARAQAISDEANARAKGDSDTLSSAIGSDEDTKDADTIKGAKKYADSKLDDVVSSIEVKKSDSDDYAAVYTLWVNGKAVSVPINIPKDMVVKSGEVVTNPEGQPVGTYIHLVLDNADNTDLYINVTSLIEYVTAGVDPDGILEITIGNDHKVVVSIKNGAITTAKLEAAFVQRVTDLETAVTEIKDGTTIDSFKDVEDAIGGVQSAITNDIANLRSDLSNEANARAQGDSDTLNAAVGTDLDTKDSDTIKGAKKFATAAAVGAEINAKAYTDEAAGDIANDISNEANARTQGDSDTLNSANQYADTQDNAVKAAIANDIANAESNAAADATSKANAAESNAKTYADARLNDAKDYANTVGEDTLNDAKDYANSVGSDTLNTAKSYADNAANTALNSAKDYADDAANDALNDAKEYVDDALTWGHF